MERGATGNGRQGGGGSRPVPVWTEHREHTAVVLTEGREHENQQARGIMAYVKRGGTNAVENT